MSALITRLQNASEHVDVVTADLLREVIVELKRVSPVPPRPRRHRTLHAALFAAHSEANPVKRSVRGGKKQDSEDFWYFAATVEVMREARRLLMAHHLLLMFTGEWITKDGLVRVEYDLVFVPTGQTQPLCWEAPPERVGSETLGVTWTARHAQRCIHLHALGIPVEDDAEARKKYEEADRQRAAAQRMTVQQNPPKNLGEAMTGAFARPSAARHRAVAAPADSAAEISEHDVGGLAPPASLPGDELDDAEYDRTLEDVAAAALRWQQHTRDSWSELFRRALSLTDFPLHLQPHNLRELQRFLAERGFNDRSLP